MKPRVRESRKNLPQTIEAEKSLLGSILLNNEVLTTVGDMVADDDFLLESNRRIFMAMKEMSDRHIPIDSLTLSDYLAKKDWARSPEPPTISTSWPTLSPLPPMPSTMPGSSWRRASSES